MPIRFRCKHCNQLLGIARRKIGMEVRCPECQKMILVPAQDAPDVDEATRKGDPPLEVDDIGAPPEPIAVSPADDKPKRSGLQAFPPVAPAPYEGELHRLPAPASVVLSPFHAMLLTLAALLTLALAFALGLLVGRFLL